MEDSVLTHIAGQSRHIPTLNLLVLQLIEFNSLTRRLQQRTAIPVHPSDVPQSPSGHTSIADSHAPELSSLWQQLGEINGLIRDIRAMQGHTLLKECDFRHYLSQLNNEEGMRLFDTLHNSIETRNEDLDTARKELEGRRDSIRAHINTATRPLIRPLKILDLPDELLRCIFDYVRGWTSDSETFFSDIQPGDIRQIKQLRLTCRQFRDTSSHLLLRYVKVDLTPASLARLEEISRHPTISKGVIAVCVVLEFYSTTLAEDIQRFARYHEIQLTRDVDIWNHFVDGPAAGQISREHIRKARAIIESWSDVAWNGVDEDDDREGTMILRRAHEQYRSFCADQVTLRGGSFSRAVASAMERLPVATWINIDDSDRFTRDPTRYSNKGIAAIDNLGILEQNLAQPIDRWEIAQIRGLDDDLPTDILSELFIATQESGIRLRGLDIWTPPPMPLTRFLPANESDHGKLRAAVKHLKKIHFQPWQLEDREFWAERELHEWAPFVTYLSILLDSAQLREISLELHFMWTSDLPPIVSMGPILLSRVWPNLESLSFDGPFHMEEMMQVITRAPQKITLELSGYLSK